MIKLDSEGKAQDLTFVLSLRNHDHLGQIRNIDPDSVVTKINMNGANEISFTVYKYNDAEAAKEAEKLGDKEALREAQEPLWDEITDFKFVYVKEIGEKGEYFEIVVEKNDEESLYKTVTGTSACEVELSQTYIYGLEINTELDIARADYTSPTVFYDPLKPEASLLNRALYKLPQYYIKHVDASLMSIQRTFSVDGTDAYSLFTNDIAQEVGCLFEFDSTNRGISVYDLKTNCVDCGHRGEFSDVCPKCGSTSLKYYGEDTTVYVDTENLAESVNLTVDTDSVKNCFKLEAGDDNMTAAIRNLNPNGSDYIYYFSEEQKHDMPNELVTKLDSYDALVESYEEEYEQVMTDMYEAIDKVIYYTSGMMPTQEDDPTNSELEAAKLTAENMSPMALTEVTSSTSTATVNTALKSYSKVFVKSGFFKIEINEGEFVYEGTDKNGDGYGYWYGNFKITNYSDEEDVATSQTIKIIINKDFDTFMDQKIKKYLALEDKEGDIFDILSIEDLNEFKEALTYYGLNRLTSFYDAVQGCVDIMIEMDQGRKNADLYQTMYIPYYNKLLACQEEIDKRQATIDEWGNKLDKAEQRQKAIQKILNFENYLGTELYKVFCMYKREDKYSNENYISDGLENDEIFENARQFLDVAKEELIKSGEHQRRISAPLANLLCMPEFEPIKDHFKEGNFIRVGIDGEVYRLRLISYQISFGDIQGIDVEFSDVTKNKNGMSDLQSILSKAKSMASTYGATVNQVEKSKKQTDFVGDFVAKGLDATAVKIVNNADNQNITMSESGLLARRKDDFYDKYDRGQLKLLSTGIYVTDDAWKSVKTALGKYYYTDPETGELTEAYGLLAEALVGNLILGNELGIYSSDGSATMSFDNYGLVLNTIDNGSGQYKRILDIQKTDADGNTTSQLYIDTDGNIVLATDQMIQVTESIDNLDAKYANIDKLYVTEATIRNLLAEYATIENLEAVNARIENLDVSKLEADFAEIKELIATSAEIDELKAGNVTIAGKLTATEAEIKDLTAENVTITGKLEAAEAEIADLEATKATIGYVDAYKAEVEQLFADYASIEYLDANYIKAEMIDAKYAQIEQLNATNAEIDNLKAKDAEIENLVADKADIEDLNAINATIENLEAENADIKNLVAEKVDAEYVDAELLEAKKAIIDELDATYIRAETLESDYAKIEYVDAEIVETEKLIAEKATIEELNAAKADIGELNANVANINSIMAGNIGTGLLQTVHLTAENVVIDDAVIKSAMIESIDTDLVTVGNDNIILSGSTQQFKDANGNVRVQIGQDAEGNFSFIVADDNGATVIDADGITEKAVPDGLIVDKMVSDEAGIQAHKVKYITEDGDTTLQTIITQQQGEISQLIKETTIDNGDGTTTSLKDAYNETVSTVEGNKTTIANVSTTVNNLTGEVETMSSKITEIETNAGGIFAKVLSIGGQNLFYHSSKDWLDRVDGDSYIFIGCYKESTDNDMEGKNVTLSVEFKTDDTTSGTFDVCYYGGNSVTEDDVKTLFTDVSISDLKDGKYVNTFIYPTTSALPVAEDGSEQMYTMVVRITNITGTLSVRKGMLQYGMMATEWQPTSDNLSESLAQVSIEADKISWLVKSGTSESNFELTSRAAELVAEEINLKGLVKFSGLDSDISDLITSGGSSVKKTETSGYEFIDRRYESDVNCRPFIYGEYTVVPATTLADGTENDSNLIKTVDDSRLYTDYIPWTFNDNPFYCSADIYYAETTDGVAYIQVGFFDEDKNPIGGNNGFNLNLVSNRSLAAADKWQTFEYNSENKIVSNDSYPRHKTRYIRLRYLARYSGQTGVSYLRNFTVKQLGATTPTIIDTDMNRWSSKAIVSGTTTINGGYIQTNTITSAQINTKELFANSAFIGAVKTVELNANMIKSGTIRTDLLDLYDLKVLHKTNGSETLSISNAGDITLRGSVESYNYVDGKAGWAIHSDGDAEFNDVTVRGSVIGNYGGIASCGGTGINLQRDTSFHDGTISNRWRYGTGYFTVDTTRLYEGTNTVKYVRTGATADASVYLYTNLSNNPVTPKAGKYYTASAKFYTTGASAIDGTKPILGVWYYHLEDDGTTSVIKSDKVDIPFVNKEWVDVSVTSECPDNADLVAIVIGAYRNGTFWIARPKLEEGNVATTWSLAPEDGIKQVVHWAGSSYEERENAPAIIYNDGSVKFETGEFGGVFTGDIEIGNISIIDPSKHSGNDALLTIQNGNNGVKRVQLRDSSSSDFAQNIIITDNFYNEVITLGQNGQAHLSSGLNIGSDETYSVLSPTRLTLNGIVIDAATSDTLKMLPTTLNVGSTSKKTKLNVYGATTLNDDLTIEGDIMISNKLKITTTSSGVDIEFVG